MRQSVHWTAAVIHFPEQVMAVWAALLTQISFAGGWVMIGRQSAVAKKRRVRMHMCEHPLCECYLFIFHYEQEHESGNHLNSTLKCTLKAIDLYFTKRKWETETSSVCSQISPSNVAKLFGSPSSAVTETDWRTFILVSLQDNTMQRKLYVGSCYRCRFWRTVSSV